jgi:hypothetical protein
MVVFSKEAQRGSQKGFNAPIRVAGNAVTFSRSTKREASDLDSQHPTKQEITSFILFYVPAQRSYF